MGLIFQRVKLLNLTMLFILYSIGAVYAQDAVCKTDPINGNQISCAISSEADCQQIHDYPYARNLFCPASFLATQKIIETLKTFIEADSSISVNSSFLFFQTPSNLFPDSQTEVSCTLTPYKTIPLITSSLIHGAGTPLCSLVGYVTSPGPTDPNLIDPNNPLPQSLRLFPTFFESLMAGNNQYPLNVFNKGGPFDGLISRLGAATVQGFLELEPTLQFNNAYGPNNWNTEPLFNGISGGGGGGWGAEILTLAQAQSMGQTLFTFGGGGGGGLTSTPRPPKISNSTYLGGGGGAGAQFANAFIINGKSYSGLGLGAGGSQTLVAPDPQGNKIKTEISYSYNDTTSNSLPETNNGIILQNYIKQLGFLKQKLNQAISLGHKVILRGGGGMGAGTEYLDSKLSEITPHALSTQAGFQFHIEFSKKGSTFSVPRRGYSSNTLTELLVNQKQNALYQKLGNIYQKANKQALNKCGNTYTNYDSCVCPTTQAITICLAMSTLGVANPALVPKWLGNLYCSKDSISPSVSPGLVSLRNDLIDALPTVIETLDSATATQPNLTADMCKSALTSFFITQDGPPAP